ncbi:hypothetical protein CLU79DRAFT_828644 [Phycomyces nitens]|nr:hypothetical protein CLU79DRAFT_828644 [Phycomyces nitens]
MQASLWFQRAFQVNLFYIYIYMPWLTCFAFINLFYLFFWTHLNCSACVRGNYYDDNDNNKKEWLKDKILKIRKIQHFV